MFFCQISRGGRIFSFSPIITVLLGCPGRNCPTIFVYTDRACGIYIDSTAVAKPRQHYRKLVMRLSAGGPYCYSFVVVPKISRARKAASYSSTFSRGTTDAILALLLQQGGFRNRKRSSNTFRVIESPFAVVYLHEKLLCMFEHLYDTWYASEVLSSSVLLCISCGYHKLHKSTIGQQQEGKEHCLF